MNHTFELDLFNESVLQSRFSIDLIKNPSDPDLELMKIRTYILDFSTHKTMIISGDMECIYGSFTSFLKF